MLGDFNTPPESRWYEHATRHRFTLANRAQSRGFVETWAWGLPVHTLDPIWLSPHFEAIGARQEARASDHRLVEATVVRRTRPMTTK